MPHQADIIRIDEGSDLFHFSRGVEELVESGSFDPERSWYGGAVYVATERTLLANCVATVKARLQLLDTSRLTLYERDKIRLFGETRLPDSVDLSGLDGFYVTGERDEGLRVYSRRDLQLGRVAAADVFCPGVVVLGRSLPKLGDIRALPPRE